MKVCRKCGLEFDGLDGANTCTSCKVQTSKAARARQKQNRAAMKEAMESLGLTKVRGSLGGTYWE